jgi:hypothetical protein
MKIAINKHGFLSIKRMVPPEEMKRQSCPKFVCPDGVQSYCGNWCPLFNLVIEKIPHSKDVRAELQLCEGRVYQLQEFDLEV